MSSPTQTSNRILFVDDESLVRDAFATSLKDRGFLVDVADGGDEALGLVRQHAYAVVATDWRMPRVDGLALIERLRPKLPHAAYLLVTGAPMDLTDVPERTRRVDGVIAKPWTLGTLASAMERGFELYAKRISERESDAAPRTNRVLLVEDNPGDAVLVTKQLGKVPSASYEIDRAERLADAIDLAQTTTYEVALVDLSLPDARGLEVIQSLQCAAPTLPIVVLSGFNDEPLALEAVQTGAQDYLVKGEAAPRLLDRSIRYAMERKLASDRLVHLAHYDQLTGLANRTLFRDRLGHAIAHARRTERRVAVLFLDVDHFKTVNDSLGHDVGDMLLEGIATRLVASVRDVDTIARLGGDEFAVLIDKMDDENHAPTVAQRILDALAKPFHFNGHEIVVSASIGLSFFPENGNSMGQLLRAADSAMYRAKDGGRNAYQFYSRDTHTRVVERVRLENELRHAVDAEEFAVHYQPQLDLRTGRLGGFEALLRWKHPERGVVSPAEFVPLLERTGLIVQVGTWVLERACEQGRRWRADGRPDVKVSVNLSARQFEDGDLVEVVERALAGDDPRYLELEITESLLMQDTERTVETLHRLKKLGVRIAIDDFGTGYSSLSYLKKFPIDSLKIDRSFVSDITLDSDSACIAAAIIALAHNLRLDVIAEGVETKDQLERLLDCDALQGYLYSPPRPDTDLSFVASRELDDFKKLLDPMAESAKSPRR